MKQHGFTLLELMISLAIGLVISAAAMMLFLTSMKSEALQLGQSALQDEANFGLNYIVKDIRLSNLNNVQSSINDATMYGGVVFRSSANVAQKGEDRYANLPLTIVGDTAAVKLLSRSNGISVDWNGPSNVEVVDDNTSASGGALLKSDQLTIQYVPQYVLDDNKTSVTTDDRWYGGYDCEGNELSFTLEQGKQIIVQRYFLREDNSSTDKESNQPLSLACDAGYYSQNGTPTKITNFGDSGEIILKRVDHFRVLYHIQNGDQQRYVDAATYLNLDNEAKPRILAVQLAALIRSNAAIDNQTSQSKTLNFQLLDQDVKVKTNKKSAPTYIRQAVSQTVAFRNTFGERG